MAMNNDYAKRIAEAVREAAAKQIDESRLDQRSMFSALIHSLDLDAIIASVPGAWISVKDRLPTHPYSVLGWVIDGPLTLNGTNPMRDIVSYFPETNEWKQNVGVDDAVVRVSHWLDIPDAPTEGKP
jgi:hypothetical protein